MTSQYGQVVQQSTLRCNQPVSLALLCYTINVTPAQYNVQHCISHCILYQCVLPYKDIYIRRKLKVYLLLIL